MWPNRGRLGGVVPIKVDEAGMPANLAPSELADVVAYVSRHRTSGEPFDVVHGGRADPAEIAASAAAGATWYLADAGVEGPGVGGADARDASARARRPTDRRHSFG